jgi:hypothetical protein
MRPFPTIAAVRCSVLAVATALAVAGCRTTAPPPPPPATPWEDCYRPIHDAAADAFVQAALAELGRYGGPRIPVRRVELRLSRKTRAARRLRIAEGFTRTACVDPATGRFVIYLRVSPGDPEFYPLLGHECGHLLDARVRDWWMEGFCTLFSARLAEGAGRSWATWERRFRRRPDEPYAVAYRAAGDLEAAVPDAFAGLFRHPPRPGPEPGWFELPFAAWLETLGPQARVAAEAVLQRPEYQRLAGVPVP